MNWIFNCPVCFREHKIEWKERFQIQICDNSFKCYHPPLPEYDIYAYVDTHEWPEDMEIAVINKKGTECSALNCKRRYETLDHRVPYSAGGRTSVENLFPMCEEHNLSKSDKSYELWEYERMYGK